MSVLTISYLTSREQPHFEWFFQSLARQNPEGVVVNVIDFYADKRRDEVREIAEASKVTLEHHITPKPTIWQGSHRITKEDWWAKSNAHNTAIALCKTNWIAFVDDRCVLAPTWLTAAQRAMRNGYAAIGTYEKWINMKVENGGIIDFGQNIGHDPRPKVLHRTKDWYGGNCVLTTEWCLVVNGYSEDYCDSLGLEDCMFGKHLYNSGCSIYFDPDLKIIEDRTQGQIDGALKRSDKGVSPNDKSHKIVEILSGSRTSKNSYNLREVRQKVLAGEPFPPPSASHIDWYDGSKIEDFE